MTGAIDARPTGAAVVARFATRAVEAGSTVVPVVGWDEVAAIARARAAEVGPGPSHATAGVTARPGIAVAPALAAVVGAPGGPPVGWLPEAQPVDAQDPAGSADVAVGVVRAVRAVAETGSVLLDETELADRLVSLLSLHLLVVVAADDVVASLDDVVADLEAHAGRSGQISLVTGPSRTADIERVLTIGVQGPAQLEVLVLP